MCAAVCGSKRSYFDDIPASTSKRLRYSSSISVQGALEQLKAVFPHLDAQDFERVLEECQNDMDAAIKKLNELSLGSAREHSDFSGVDADVEKVNLPVNGPEWVELFVKEMMISSSLDDARARASRVMEALEKSVVGLVSAEAEEQSKENKMLKEQVEVLIRDNSILKRAVAIQHERQKEYEEKNQEILHLKQQLSQSQEQLRKLELDNYALSMLLRQAQQGNCMPKHFNPDVF